MNKYKLSFDVERIGHIEFDVSEETYHTISQYCKENFPEIEWQNSVNKMHVA